jgi:3-hydroxyisobutyrate dehydrogenase-like beta-hydroxyacid dehydrogenase
MCDSPIGLIGVGLLGTALAERMLGGGLSVLGFDRDGAQCERLRALGGNAAADAAAVAERCGVLVLCLPESDVVAAVMESIREKMVPGLLVIDATTGDPEATAKLAAELAERKIGYVDATIAGSSEQVRQGEAAVLCGGTTANYGRAAPVLRTWGEKRFHVGPAGSGARMKLVVNLVLGLNRAVLAEGLSLAGACGLDRAAALTVLKSTPAYSAVMDTKGARMVAGDYERPVARLAQHAKDVRLIRELARRDGAVTPLSDVHEELLRRAIEAGYGDRDNSAVIEAFKG